MKKYISKTVLLILLIYIFTFSNLFANSPDCSLCYDDPDFVNTAFSGDQNACYNQYCIPINDYSPILVIVGGISALFMVVRKRKLI